MRTILSSVLSPLPSDRRNWGSQAALGLLIAMGVVVAGCGESSYAADTGFRPAKDGFGFANYGSDTPTTELVAARVQELFGDQICASKAGGQCMLTPPGERWRKQMNYLSGFGHCEGMAVLSSLLFTKSSGLAASQFGAATTSELPLTGNLTLQTEIAKWASTQILTPTRFGEFGRENTPKEVIEKLRHMWSAGEYPTLRLSQQHYLDGHTLFPYQIIDKGGATIALRVYDPDYPKQEREVQIDLNTNKWSYVFSVSAAGVPYEYAGDAITHSLLIVATSGRLGKQDCPFCSGSAGSNAATAGYTAMTQNGDALLRVLNSKNATDPLGLTRRRIPSEYTLTRGELGSEGHELALYGLLPGPTDALPYFPSLLNHPGPPAIINIPSAYDSTIKLIDEDMTKDLPSAITLTGHGYELVVENIVLHPGQEDTILIAKGQGQITYSTTADETPDLTVGFESPDASFELSIIAHGKTTGVSVTLKKDQTKGEFSFQIKGDVNYTLQMVRIDAQGEQVFSHGGESVTDNDTIHIHYGTWKGQGMPLKLEIDAGSDGTIDQMVDITDQDLPRM